MNENENLVPKRRFKEFTNTGTWEQRKLEDLGSFKNGMNFDKSAMGHGHPFINLQNIFGKTVVDDKDLGLAVSSEKQRNEYNLLKGDILFIRSSVKPEGVGEAALVPKNFENTTFSGFIIRFRPHITIDDEFKRVIFATKTVRNQIMALATSSANTNINQISLGKIIIELPELSEQSKIGNLFKQLDNAIALHQRKLDKAKELKSAYLSEMFPAEGERKPKRRFAGFTDDWEQRKLGEESIIVAGGDVDKTKVLKSGKYPVLANALTNDGIFGYYEDDYRIEAPAVTVTGRGDVGYAKARKTNFTPVVRLLAVKSEHDVDFLEVAINNHKTIVESTGVPQLTAPQLSNYNIYFPSFEEERKIGAFFKHLDDTIVLHQHKLEKLQNIKQAYLNEMFV